MMQVIADKSRETYRELVYETPGLSTTFAAQRRST